MTSPYADYEKSGYKKMLDLAKVLCRLVNQWAVVITAKYGENIAMMALLTAVQGLCELLPEADAAYQSESLVTTPPPSDVENIAGFDPSAPPAEAPDYTEE